MKTYRRLFLVLVHVLLWSVLILFPKFFLPVGFRLIWRNELLLWLPVIVFFYLNYFVLVPFFLTRKKFLLYTVSIIAILVFTSFLGWYSIPPNVRPGKAFMPPPKDNFAFIPFRGLRNLTSCFLFLAISTSIRVTEQWYINEKQRKDMENQKLTAELSFLKSQINPHFFFNTLNSIYSLAVSKSEKTPEAVIKLSELMRFIIYDSEKEFVPLKRELDYINNYVELQKLRLMSNIKVDYQIEGNYTDKRIEPLLLLPFIENAFKHGIDAIKQCEIKVLVKVFTHSMLLVVENPVVKPNKIQERELAGIGLANSKKRLELLYGTNHQLNISQSGDEFKIELNLTFKNHELYHS